MGYNERWDGIYLFFFRGNGVLDVGCQATANPKFSGIEGYPMPPTPARKYGLIKGLSKDNDG